MLGKSSRVALITNSFGSIKALGTGISAVTLGSISIKSSVCAFSFNRILYCYIFSSQLRYVQADSLKELRESFS